MELATLLQQQEDAQQRITELRALIESLETHLKLSADPIAKQLLETMTLADEVRELLKSRYPAWLRPLQIKHELERIGVDLARYSNSQSTIHTILKRMAESENDYTQQQTDKEGKTVYRCPGVWKSITEVIERRRKK